jgi:hypothetical protein
MSLVSASTIIGGVKEYAYRGIQQLPIILTTTSLLFATTTGSIAHINLALGLGVLMPLYTYLAQTILGLILGSQNTIYWTRASGDTCNIIQTAGKKPLSSYDITSSTVESVPSYWLMNVGFFIGFAFSNGVDTLMTPSVTTSDPRTTEQRNTQAGFIMLSTLLFTIILLGVRLRYMNGCEGRGGIGIAISAVFCIGASLIGWGVYSMSKKCGARSSDLFGVLSQMIPASSASPNPIVCTSN